MEELFTARGLIHAIGLVCLIEGLTYGLFPNAMRRMLADISAWPAQKLRNMGFGIALCGLTLLVLWQSSGNSTPLP